MVLSPTDRQERERRILRAVLQSPASMSIRELQAHLGLNSRAQTQKHLLQLEEAGLLSRVPYQHRSLRVTALGRQALNSTTPEP